MKVAVIGAGSWGTSMASHVASLGNEVTIWAREPEVVQGINGEGRNPVFLPDIDLPEGIKAFDAFQPVLEGAETVIMAVPSKWTRDVAGSLKDYIPPDVPVMNLAKGFDFSTGKRLSVTIAEELGRGMERVAALSGPNLAEEVAKRIPSATVIASTDIELAARLQRAFSSPYFRIYTNADVVGVEVGGACKNIMAIASGIVDGLGMGDNTKASLIARGVAETTRFGCRLGANPTTFSGLSGIGDLIATCISRHSRNRGFGQKLGEGERAEELLSSAKMVVEGVYATRLVLKAAQDMEIEVPITSTVDSIINGKMAPQEAVEHLMTRPLKQEIEEDLFRDFLLQGSK